jgi:hypothetical protein
MYDDSRILHQALPDAHIPHESADASFLQVQLMWRNTIVGEKGEVVRCSGIRRNIIIFFDSVSTVVGFWVG